MNADRFGPAEAAHLMWRAGFGVRWSDAQRIADAGLEKAVASLFVEPERGEAPPPFAVLPEASDREFMRGLADLPEDQRRALRARREQRNRDAIEPLKDWWLRRMLETRAPLVERMTLFWHSHFASSFEDKIESTYAMWAQNQRWREHALAPFPELLRELIRDPAMLVWLDNASSTRHQPNENLGRELMELFSMGVNQYTEEDIKAAARALTGYTVDRDRWAFRFDRSLHDDTGKTFLGWTGDFNGDDIVEIICRHKATPHFIARKILSEFATGNPPAEIQEEAAKRLDDSEFSIRELLSALFLSEWFYSEPVRGALVKCPVTLCLGAVRSMRIPLPPPKALLGTLRLMGQDLFFPPDVNGWPGGLTWINSNTLLIRYNFANFLIHGVSADNFSVPDPDAPASARRDFVESQRSGDAAEWHPRQFLDAIAGGRPPTAGREIVDLFVREFLQRPVPDALKDQLLAYCATDSAGGRKSFDINDTKFDERAKGLVHLIMSSPDYQMC
jgi:hypothetical protein